MIYTLSRSTLAFVWLWQGLVPKLIAKHPDEYVPLIAAGFDRETAEMLVAISGWAEIAFALLIVLLWNMIWPLWLSIIAMTFLLIGVLATTPELALGAFTPVTLNILVVVVAVIAIAAKRKLEGS